MRIILSEENPYRHFLRRFEKEQLLSGRIFITEVFYQF